MRKYSAIAKIYPDKYVKYRTNNPENLVKFLIQKFNNVLWVNFCNSAVFSHSIISPCLSINSSVKRVDTI